MIATSSQRKSVAVFPPSAWETESRLFVALAKLFPVDFVRGGDIAWERTDAAIVFHEAHQLSEAMFERGVSSFRFVCSGRGIPLNPDASVTFSHNTVLHPALWNARIPVGSETCIAELSACDAEVPLAYSGSAKLWQFRAEGGAELHTSAVAAPALRGEDLLWEWLRPSNWLALLPLMQFLRRVTAEIDWSPAPTQACFMFDDPNLHSVCYGHIDFSQLVNECIEHKYHVAIATIPFDGWYAASAAVDVFHRNREFLSLLIHGNDHVANELARELPPDEALRLLAQALRRVERFERRTGLTVGRVIAPPHGGCSESMAEQMLRLPLEGLCTAVGSLARSYRTSSSLEFGLSPVSFLAREFPMLRRWDLSYGLTPLRIAAFLGQPIMPYGHHGDCAGGIGRLAEVADAVNSWGPTTWVDPVSILRSRYRTKRNGEMLQVQMWSRHVQVTIPEGISYVVVHDPFSDDPCQMSQTSAGLIVVNSAAGTTEFPVRVKPAMVLDVKISSRRPVDHVSVGPPPRRIWPAIRRTLAIGRDRLTPVLRSVRAFTTADSFAETL